MNRHNLRRRASLIYGALLSARDNSALRLWWIRLVYMWAWDGMRHDQFTHRGLKMGDRSYGIRHETVQFPTGKEELVVGKYCSVAEGVRVIFGEHSLARVSTFPLKTVLCADGTNQDAHDKGPVIIGCDVWVGTNALIMSGVSLGHGCVVAAGAVVTRNVPPYAVVAGVPARIIKYRFTTVQIQQLLELAWWDWPETKIKANMNDFYEDISMFLLRHLPASKMSGEDSIE